MLVRVVVSFSAMIGGEMTPWHVGSVAELPEGVNWLDLGWVVPVDAPQSPVAETTDEEPTEKKPRRRGKAAE
jgi:hypothetical protein